jgi:hypothetical protein
MAIVLAWAFCGVVNQSSSGAPKGDMWSCEAPSLRVAYVELNPRWIECNKVIRLSRSWALLGEKADEKGSLGQAMVVLSKMKEIEGLQIELTGVFYGGVTNWLCLCFLVKTALLGWVCSFTIR